MGQGQKAKQKEQELYKSDAVYRFLTNQIFSASSEILRVKQEIKKLSEKQVELKRGRATLVELCRDLKVKSVRRVPAWTPKEGDAVFFRFGDKACPGILLGDSLLQYGDKQIRCFDLKPFSAEKIGKNWEEI